MDIPAAQINIGQNLSRKPPYKTVGTWQCIAMDEVIVQVLVLKQDDNAKKSAAILSQELVHLQ